MTPSLAAEPPMVLMQLAQDAGPMGALSSFMPILLVVGIFYFMVIRPQNQAKDEHQKMLSSLKKGDEVVTDGGLIAAVVEVGDGFFRLEIAPAVIAKVALDAVRARRKAAGEAA